MSMRQEKLFFEYLRSVLKPGQVVVLTSSRDSVKEYVDKVYDLSVDGRIQTAVTSPTDIVPVVGSDDFSRDSNDIIGT